MLPVDEQLFREDQAAIIRNLQKRVKRLETLEDAGGGDWILIENIVLTNDGDPVSFTAIPQIHKHLFVLYSAGAASSGILHIEMNFNNDVGANYNYIGNIFSNTGARSTDALANATFIHVGRAANQQLGRNKNYAAGHIFIADYRGIDNFKAVVFSNYHDALGAFEVPDGFGNIFGGGVFEDVTTAAIAEIDFTLEAAADFRERTVFSLYGVN